MAVKSYANTSRVPGLTQGIPTRHKNIKDTEKTPFNTMTMILKGTLGLFCFHIAQLMTHLSYINSTVFLPVMLQAFWHPAESNKESKGLYIKA